MILTLWILFAYPSDSLILNSDIIYKDVALAIAHWETGNYKSKAYKQKNNLFGFKRKQVLRYKTKQASVNAYSNFETRVIDRYKIRSESQYLERISKFYAKSSQWKQQVKRNLRSRKNGV